MKRSGLILVLAFGLALVVGCSDDANSDGGQTDDGSGDAGDVALADGSDADDPEPDATGDAADASGSDEHCPTDELPSETSLTYDGSTIGKPNLYESNRLEWGDAGDDALLYVVPEAGTYEFSMVEGSTENRGCGISIYDMHDHFFGPADCPAEGEVRQLPDAYFVAGEGHSGTTELTADQELLVLISCSSWSSPEEEADYTIGIEKQ